MGTVERRAREREEIRSKILEAARDLFVAEGYDAVTLRKVADAIEYSPAAIYKYFRDKEEMVRALADEDVAHMLAAFQPSLKEKNPVERVRSFGLAYMNLALEQPNHYRLMFMTPLLVQQGIQSGSEETSNDPERDAYALFRSVIVECIEANLFRPEYNDADAIAQTFWAALHGIASLHIALGSDPKMTWTDLSQRVDIMQDVLMRGMLREPEKYEKAEPRISK